MQLLPLLPLQHLLVVAMRLLPLQHHLADAMQLLLLPQHLHADVTLHLPLNQLALSKRLPQWLLHSLAMLPLQKVVADQAVAS